MHLSGTRSPSKYQYVHLLDVLYDPDKALHDNLNYTSSEAPPGHPRHTLETTCSQATTATSNLGNVHLQIATHIFQLILAALEIADRFFSSDNLYQPDDIEYVTDLPIVMKFISVQMMRLEFHLTIAQTSGLM